MRLDFNTDPSTARVAAIAILLFFEALIPAVLTIPSEGEMPTDVQWLTIILIAALQLVTFLSTFLRTGEIPTEAER